MLNFKKFKSNENKKEFFKLIILLATMFTVIGLVGGWVNNIIWLLNQDNLVLSGGVIVSIIGIPVAPIGMIHGIWLWF